MTRKIILCCSCTIATFCGIWLFLWLQCPQYLLYHEQNQLFLFTASYFADSISVPGGLADYISEFVVQFYYVPVLGALFTALILTLSQVFTGLACRRCDLAEAVFPLAAIPPVIYLGAMSDENVLLSYAVAMTLTTIFIFLATFFKKPSTWACAIILTIGFAVLYWIAGPIAIAFVIAAGILHRRPMAVVIGIPVAFILICAVHSVMFGQYPLGRMLQGINYYRVPGIYPASLFVIAAIMALFPLAGRLRLNATRTMPYVSTAAVAIFAILYVPVSFDKSKSRILAYDSLVRQGKWTEIIEKAQKENPCDIFSLQAVNLALGMKGQLPESMFQYNQNGVEGLIGKDRLDNTTQLITAEALFRLGLTNIAFSTTFDLQESIMNDRKSGRLMKRMAECMLINGNYKVAAKYIGFLRNSLFYADWARNAEKLLDNDRGVEAHPLYGPMRINAFKKEAFYDHTQIDKILAMLAFDSDGSNTLAWQYFCAATMLKGDIATLAGVLNSFSKKTGLRHIPRHVQEAIAMYWTFNHTTFDGLPFPLSDGVKQQTAALAKAVMQNKNNPSAWQKAAPGTYGVYFLNNSYARKPAESSPEYQPTHE